MLLLVSSNKVIELDKALLLVFTTLTEYEKVSDSATVLVGIVTPFSTKLISKDTIFVDSSTTKGFSVAWISTELPVAFEAVYVTVVLTTSSNCTLTAASVIVS